MKSSFITLVSSAFVASVMLLPTAADAQSRPVYRDPVKGRSFEKDVTRQVNFSKFKPGMNLIDKTPSGMALYAYAQKGKAIKYVIRDANGKQVEPVAAKKGTTCWECGVDANGDRHCWKVPCPDIVGPWVPGKGVATRY